MSHVHEGEHEEFIQPDDGVFTVPAEDGLGTVVIRIPHQSSSSQATGIRFLKIPWESGVDPLTVDPDTHVIPVIHFVVEATDGSQDGTVSFYPPISLEVPYSTAVLTEAAVNRAQDLSLGFFDDHERVWKTFGQDLIFGHRQEIQILDDPQVAIVSGIERWADPHIGWRT